MEWKVSVSTVALPDLSYESFCEFKANGIELFELSLAKELYETIDYSVIKANAEKAGVKIRSFHLPFYPKLLNDPSSLEEEYRKTTLDLQKRMIATAAYLGCEIAVIHPSREPYEDHEREARLAASKEVLGILAEYAARFGIQLAVENLPRTCIGRDSKEILELISADERLGVCYDTNHLLSESAETFIEACGDRIVTLHVSDYDFLDERHWLPGEGKNDWTKIVSSLKKVGYNGPWNYEVNSVAPASIARRDDLKASDYKRNAEEVLTGGSITVIGTPATDLKHWHYR